ncbi:unnamed protein product [Cylindrotheca closterium]|uniref:Uncharacterized protein n=1 Tax=Cylindrotheca closterium TaxID=2856 RepID=A0AAD2FL04_9STRA|nr:unnamed protein product [Cylindrotheca closterium]
MLRPAAAAGKQRQQQDKSMTEKNDDDTTKSDMEEDQYEIYLVIVELMLAVYYSYDALVTFGKLWRVPNFNIESELFDVLLDMVAYTYLTVRLRSYVIDHNSNSNNNNEDTAKSPPAEEATSYVGMKDKGDEMGV